MRNLSNNSTQFVETNPIRCEEIPKRRRGRPPKSKSTRSVLMHKTNEKTKDLYPSGKEKVDCDVNLRRESYKISIVNNESMVSTAACSPKQLIQFGDARSGYRESLIKFSKDLGPTARKVALQKLQGHKLNYQARKNLAHLVQSSEVQPTPGFRNVNSIIGSAGNTKANQVSQPLIGFGNSHTDSIENYKGKNVMVNDGVNNRNNKNMGNNMDFLFGNQKVSGTKFGNGYVDNQDGVQKSGQVGNQRTINQVGSFFSSYNENLNQSSIKIPGIEDVSAQKNGFSNASEVPSRNGKVNSRVYPSTYVPPSRKFSSSFAGFDGIVKSIPWAPPPSVHVPQQMQPPQNWPIVSPPETKNSLEMNDFWQGQDMQHALTFNMQMTSQQSNGWFQNPQAPSQPDQFLQPNPQQPQDQVLMPMSTHMLSKMETTLGAYPEQNLLMFGTQHGFGYQMGKNLFHQPPGS